MAISTLKCKKYDKKIVTEKEKRSNTSTSKKRARF